MSFFTVLHGFFLHFRLVIEMSAIIIFGYIMPIVETLAEVKSPEHSEQLSNEKRDSLLGLWTGVITLEAFLVPVGSDYSSLARSGAKTTTRPTWA